MFDFLSPLTLLLFLNSTLTIGLVLNQNESTKDSMNTQSSSSVNPLENITWICLATQLILLLIKVKTSDI